VKSGRRPFEHCHRCVAVSGCEGGCYHVSEKLSAKSPEGVRTIRKPPPIYCEVLAMAANLVTWVDCELRPWDQHWWARGNSRAKEYLRRFGNRQSGRQQQGGQQQSKRCSGNCHAHGQQQQMGCDRECPGNVERDNGFGYLQSGPYTIGGSQGGPQTERIILSPDCVPTDDNAPVDYHDC
jgi:hypothetical protein